MCLSVRLSFRLTFCPLTVLPSVIGPSVRLSMNLSVILSLCPSLCVSCLLVHSSALWLSLFICSSIPVSVYPFSYAVLPNLTINVPVVSGHNDFDAGKSILRAIGRDGPKIGDGLSNFSASKS